MRIRDCSVRMVIVFMNHTFKMSSLIVKNYGFYVPTTTRELCTAAATGDPSSFLATEMLNLTHHSVRGGPNIAQYN